MNIKSLATKGTLAAAAAAVVAGVAFTPAAQAVENPSTMNRAQLEQAVLRAQPNKTLGTWEQNFYFDNNTYGGGSAAALKPYVCPSKVPGQQVTLPKADQYGAVGYTSGPGNNASITIWQYDSAAKAQAAAAAFNQVDCADSVKVTFEDPNTTYPAQGGGDFSASTVAGQRSYEHGYQFKVADEGIEVAVAESTRPVGNTVVRTEVTVAGKKVSRSAYEKAANTANAWNTAASKAVLKYSGMDPHAA